MSYAQHRKIIDADSHVIELDDFLHAAAKAEHKDLIPLMSALGNKLEETFNLMIASPTAEAE